MKGGGLEDANGWVLPCAICTMYLHPTQWGQLTRRLWHPVAICAQSTHAWNCTQSIRMYGKAHRPSRTWRTCTAPRHRHHQVIGLSAGLHPAGKEAGLPAFHPVRSLRPLIPWQTSISPASVLRARPSPLPLPHRMHNLLLPLPIGAASTHQSTQRPCPCGLRGFGACQAADLSLLPTVTCIPPCCCSSLRPTHPALLS